MEMHRPPERTTHQKAVSATYALVSGFLIGFCVAAGIGILLVYAVKALEGIDE